MENRITSSFRDPSGYVFRDKNTIKRAINPSYFDQFDSLTRAGFYQKMFDKKYLIPHYEISRDSDKIVIEPQQIPFISYPYEWSFLQYKHAALLTLKLQKFCLQNDFTLKDASAFNITFYDGRPIFIDTLSFEEYVSNSPWQAYRQYIMHFIGPLVLAKYFGPDFLKTLSYEIEGVSLQKLSKLLPLSSYFSATILTNIHLLARFDKKYSGNSKTHPHPLSKTAQIKLIDSLYEFVKDLSIKQDSEWEDYYDQINYSDASYLAKKSFTQRWFSQLSGKSIIDIGGNDGTFSRELEDTKLVIVADIDANAVQQNYQKCLANKLHNIVPIVVDFLNPVSNYGFNNEERFSIIGRLIELNSDGCMALAVIHHITLSGNIPFEMSAQFFARLSPNLLIEFPERDDSWVIYLLESKRESRNLFDFYNADNFEKAYSQFFSITQKTRIPDSARIFYTMTRK